MVSEFALVQVGVGSPGARGNRCPAVEVDQVDGRGDFRQGVLPRQTLFGDEQGGQDEALGAHFAGKSQEQATSALWGKGGPGEHSCTPEPDCSLEQFGGALLENGQGLSGPGGVMGEGFLRKENRFIVVKEDRVFSPSALFEQSERLPQGSPRVGEGRVRNRLVTEGSQHGNPLSGRWKNDSRSYQSHGKR